MAQQISECNETPGRKLGRHIADVQIFGDVRKVMYTTNAIESLNSALRRLNSRRSVFPSDTALLKALYLATFESTKKWTMSLRNRGKVYGELSIMYDGRPFLAQIFHHVQG